MAPLCKDLKGILLFFQQEKPELRGLGVKERRRLSEVTKSHPPRKQNPGRGFSYDNLNTYIWNRYQPHEILRKTVWNIFRAEEILRELTAHCGKFEVKRELSDDKGIYLLEVEKEGGTEKESILYAYQRKGAFSTGSQSLATVIHVAYFDDGMPVGGDIVSEYNLESKMWEKK